MYSYNKETKTVTIFGKEISLNAFIVLVAGSVLSIVVSALFFPYGLAIGLVIFIGSLIAAYNVNCTLVGHCEVWAWILVFLYVIAIVMHLVMIFSDKKEWLNAFSQSRYGKVSNKLSKFSK